MELILGLPAGHELNKAAIVQLLQAAMLVNNAGCVGKLCSLPAAKQLSSDDLECVLMAAAGRESVALYCDETASAMLEFVNWFLQLPLAQQLSSSTLSVIVAKVVQHRGFCSLKDAELFCRLPEAEQLSSSEVLDLLKVLVGQVEGDSTTDRAVELLCKLPSAQQLSTSNVIHLLESVMTMCVYPFSFGRHRLRSPVAVESLCRLPAAQQIDSRTLRGLMKSSTLWLTRPTYGASSAGQGCVTATHSLSQPPAAGPVSVGEVFSLLTAAVAGSCYFIRNSSTRVLCALCQLPAAEPLRRPHVLQLLKLAARDGYGCCAAQLCRLPAAKQLSKKEVRMLLGAAKQDDNFACLQSLWRLPAAQQLKWRSVA
jgi:hypothetical protein